MALCAPALRGKLAMDRTHLFLLGPSETRSVFKRGRFVRPFRDSSPTNAK